MKRILRLAVYAFVFIAAPVSCQTEDSRRDDGYCLEDEVVFSRHNIRSPLSTSGSELSLITPYKWVDWGVEAAHLTERGGTVDDVTVSKTITAGIVRFVYFYDVLAKKYVIITLEGESDGSSALPAIVESKGPLPIDFEHGYVAFEDLPAEKRHLPGEKPGDEDDDDDEDSEEGEVIYDEDEK